MSDPLNPLWYPSPEFNAQAAHLLGGMVAIFATESMFPRHMKRCLILFLIVIFVKEMWLDVVIELDTYAESLKDFFFYAGGALFAHLLLMFFGRGGWLDKSQEGRWGS